MNQSGRKWLLSLALGILFVIIALPYTYNVTDEIFKHLKLDTTSSSQTNITTAGIIIHFVVFTLLARLILAFY
jgi:multisubunit Na+/H+ antiporter MnhB subunit